MPVPSVSKTSHYAQFATSSRLLSCLVTEGLLDAYVHVWPSFAQTKALCLIFYKDSGKLLANNIHSVVPLKELPIIESNHTYNGLYRAKLVDPTDMSPAIYTPTSASYNQDTTWFSSDYVYWKRSASEYMLSTFSTPSNFQLGDRIDAAALWTSFAVKINVPKPLMNQIAMELTSSVTNQKYAYDHPRPLPSLESPSIEWEQCVFEGHATHPMHKARYAIPPMTPIEGGNHDLFNPKIRVVAVPRSSLMLRGDFETLLQPLIKAMFEKTKQVGNFNEHVLIPVHELQLPNIKQLFGDAIVLPEECSVYAQAMTSLRSVVIPDVLPEFSLKLCVGMKVTSALRTITPFTTYFGPGFSANVVPRLTVNREILQIERELASACYRHDDFNIAKHCSCVVREAFENTSVQRGEKVIVCAALVEKCQRADAKTTLVEHAWGLDSEDKRLNFLDRYIKLALEAFLPPCIHNGVAFEAHGQNTLARFDLKTGELIGFVIRDFGGIKAHQESLTKSCGVQLDVLPDSCVVAEKLDEVYKLLYHTLIYGHLNRLIRVLGFHYNGRGWAILRQYLKQMIPKDHPLAKAWLEQSEIPGKCLIQMKIDELYRDYIYRDFPNLILYEPQQVEIQDILIKSSVKSLAIGSAISEAPTHEF